MDRARVPHLAAPQKVERQPFSDPDFIRASEWLARDRGAPRLIVLGAPFGAASISGARCDLAPDAIRAVLAKFSVWSSDHAISVDAVPVWDAGNVEPDGADVVATQARIEDAVAALLEQADVPIVVVGGDNSITVGAARGARADGLLTFDAHHDCRDPSTRVTNGCPVRQLIDGGLQSIVQIGIHGFSNSEANARWASDHKVHVVPASAVRAGGVARAVAGAMRLLGEATRVWVDVDLDVLDRAFAPGAPAAMPGGLQPADLTDAAFLLGSDPRVAGLDLTEVDPETDVTGSTVRTAAAVMLSFAAGIASRAAGKR